MSEIFTTRCGMLKVDYYRPASQAKFTGSVRQQRKMPVDFASYLLASSPPGFDLHYTLREHFGEPDDGSVSPTKRRGKPRPGPLTMPTFFLRGEDLDHDLECLDDDCSYRFTEEDGDILPFSPTSPNEEDCCSPRRKLKKKVSFADDAGLSLVSIRYLTESSDTPPNIRSTVLSSLTQGASAGVTGTPPLVLNFAQPASNYLEFRNKLEVNSVALENVILKDYSLIATVKVLNLAFKKSVYAHCTFDDWESFEDIPATYVPNAVSVTARGTPVDTFSLKIDVPPNMDIRKKIHFAICFEVSGSQYWDSNEGQNYEVVSADFNSLSQMGGNNQNTTDRIVFGLRPNNDTGWSEYSGWANMDKSTPYY